MKDSEIRKKDELHAQIRVEKLIRSLLNNDSTTAQLLKAKIQSSESVNKSNSSFQNEIDFESSKESPDGKGFQKLTKSFTIKMNKSPKSSKASHEDDNVRSLLEIFKSEVERRRSILAEQKQKKDKLVEEIEHDKTQMKIVGNKSDKIVTNSLCFPITVEVSLISCRINNEIAQNSANCCYYYTLECGKRLFTSDESNSITNPSWNNYFSLVLNANNSNLIFTIIRKNNETKNEEKVDDIVILASDIQTLLFENKHLIDSVTSPLKNKYTYSIKNKSDSCSKIRNLSSSIKSKEDLYKSQVYPAFESAKDEYDKILNLTGVNLLKNWGILGSDIYSAEVSNDMVQLSPDSRTTGSPQSKDKKEKTVNVSDINNFMKKSQLSKESTNGFVKQTTNVMTPSKGLRGEVQKSPNNAESSNLQTDEEIKTPSRNSDNFSSSMYKSFTNQTTHAISPNKKRKVVKKKKEINGSPNESEIINLNQSCAQNSVPKLLSSRHQNYSAMKGRRSILENSLVYSALIEIQESNKIKSQYKEPKNQPFCIGKMFHSYDISKIITSMYSTMKRISEESEICETDANNN